jgi:hypothetical protein
MAMASARRRTALVVAACAAAALAPAVPASAVPASAALARSAAGWRIVFRNSCAATTGCAYFDVSAPGRSSAWVVGEAGGNGGPGSGHPIAARWHNGVWRPASLPAGLSGLLIAVSADSARDAWAVSADTGYALHWNGTRWSVARRWHEGSLSQEFTGVTAFGPHDVWAFGGPGAFPGLGTWHFNGRTWTRVASGPGAGIVSASALSPSDMWAIGSINSPQDSIIHYLGTTWRQVHAAALSGLAFSGITATAPGSVWSVATKPGTGNPNTAYVVRLQNGHWTRTRLPWRLNPVRVAGDGHGGVWLTALGTGSAWFVHRSAAGRWTRVLAGSPASVFGLTLLPGTSALWSAGDRAATAAIWAFGRTG